MLKTDEARFFPKIAFFDKMSLGKKGDPSYYIRFGKLLEYMQDHIIPKIFAKEKDSQKETKELQKTEHCFVWRPVDVPVPAKAPKKSKK